MEQIRLGERLRLAREHARLSQTEAAEALGITSAALSQYEAGKRRVAALTLDRLGRRYGIPLGFFFGQDAARPDWEEALRAMATPFSAATKAGIVDLVAHLRALEELYRCTDTPLPTPQHPPFGPLPEVAYRDKDVLDYAEQVRQHYALGTAPLPGLREFLEGQGYLVFTIPLGQEVPTISGLYFAHPALGPVIAINGDQAYGRRSFTMAHEFTHALFHYDRPAVLCRTHDPRPLEQFADRFASYFLVPRLALHEQVRLRGMETVNRPEEVVHLARYFDVSYGAMLHCLRTERRLSGSTDAFIAVKPIALAKALGYTPSPYEFGVRPLPIEERFPRVFVELALRAAREDRLSLRRIAELLGISDIELEERLYLDEEGGAEETEAELAAATA